MQHVVHRCDLCNEVLDQVKEIETAEGVLVAGVGHVRMQGRVREVCVPCLDAFKRLTEDLEAWSVHRARAADRIATERARVAAEDAERAAEAEKRRLEEAAAAARVEAAREQRAAQFETLAETDQLRLAVAALLDGSATPEEVERFAELVKPAENVAISVETVEVP